MDEIIEAGLGTTVAGAIMTALSTVAAGAAGLATAGTVLIPTGIVLAGLGVYNTMKANAVAAVEATK